MIYRLRTSNGELKALLSVKVATDIFDQVPGRWDEASNGNQMFVISSKHSHAVASNNSEIILVLWGGDVICLDKE